jgi:hypothetical protein
MSAILRTCKKIIFHFGWLWLRPAASVKPGLQVVGLRFTSLPALSVLSFAVRGMVLLKNSAPPAGCSVLPVSFVIDVADDQGQDAGGFGEDHLLVVCVDFSP